MWTRNTFSNVTKFRHRTVANRKRIFQYKSYQLQLVFWVRLITTLLVPDSYQQFLAFSDHNNIVSHISEQNVYKTPDPPNITSSGDIPIHHKCKINMSGKNQILVTAILKTWSIPLAQKIQ